MGRNLNITFLIFMDFYIELFVILLKLGRLLKIEISLIFSIQKNYSKLSLFQRFPISH